MPYDKRDIKLIKKVEEDKESMNLKEKKKYYDRMGNLDIKDRVIRKGNFSSYI